MPHVVLYGLHRSVYTRIAALTLLEKGVSYELDDIEIFAPAGVPTSHFGRHPFGRIPVLQYGDFLLYETQAICRFVDEAFDGPRLQPNTPSARARMVQVIGVLDSYAYRPMVWDVFVQRVGAPLQGRPADEAAIAAAIPKVQATLSALAGLLDGQLYFGGTSPSLADFHAYPMLTVLGLASEGDAALHEQPQLANWRARMSERPSAVKTRTKYECSAGDGAA